MVAFILSSPVACVCEENTSEYRYETSQVILVLAKVYVGTNELNYNLILTFRMLYSIKFWQYVTSAPLKSRL